MVFFVFNELRVRRGDCSLLILGELLTWHHCFNFLLIIFFMLKI
jgi:hypothetical protein